MNFNIFKNIFYEDIALIHELSKKNPDNILNVKNNYSRKKSNLLENLNFLIKINFLNFSKNKITIKLKSDSKLNDEIIRLTLKDPEYGPCLKNYLINFSNNDSELNYFTPSRSYNYESSALRDFLITFGYIKNQGKKFILLRHEILDEIKKRKFTPKQLDKKIKIQNEIGEKAEKIIFEYEKKLIKNMGINKIPSHVALEDVSAGYDILSYRMIDNQIKQIFIEVKAVSFSNYQFHLSVPEYQTAIKLNPYYYVYLLPVDYSLPKGFNLENLLKINEIKRNLLEDKNKWKVSPDGYLISKKI